MIELFLKYSEAQVAMYRPDFNRVFRKKAKLEPTLPQSLIDLKDLPDNYKQIKKKLRILISLPSDFSKFITFSSLDMLIILASSKEWYCNGTFKSAPAHFYQHYIIHGLHKN